MQPALRLDLGPFYTYKGQILCITCDSHRNNPYWFCATCLPHKYTDPTAKKA